MRRVKDEEGREAGRERVMKERREMGEKGGRGGWVRKEGREVGKKSEGKKKWEDDRRQGRRKGWGD